MVPEADVTTLARRHHLRDAPVIKPHKALRRSSGLDRTFKPFRYRYEFGPVEQEPYARSFWPSGRSKPDITEPQTFYVSFSHPMVRYEMNVIRHEIYVTGLRPLTICASAAKRDSRSEHLKPALSNASPFAVGQHRPLPEPSRHSTPRFAAWSPYSAA